jgi:hypothetical protein
LNEARAGPDWVAVRRVALGVYFAVLVWSTFAIGVPIAHDRIFLFTFAGLACACIGRTWRSAWHLLIDWVPFALVIIGYDYSRGWADSVGFGPYYSPQLDVDRLLFFGNVPTVWLQDHLYQFALTRTGHYTISGEPKLWEVVLAVVYVTHYLFSFILAGILWAKERRRFQAFARRFVTLSYMGFVTYVVFPAAPPWLAAQHGDLPGFVGRYGRGFDRVGLHSIRDLIDKGAATSNLTAAVPSLHFGFATLIAITLWDTWPRWSRPFLVVYPLLMGLSLVTTGEHYVSDLLLGGAYAFIAHIAWNHIEGWWQERGTPAAADRELSQQF